MERKRLAGLVASSADPTEISNRVKGIVLGLSSVIILIATQFFHITLSPADLVTFATQAGAVAGAIWTIYGAGLALVRFLATPK